MSTPDHCDVCGNEDTDLEQRVDLPAVAGAAPWICEGGACLGTEPPPAELRHYDKIVAALNAGRHHALLTALERAVEDESVALAVRDMRQTGGGNIPDEEAAEGFYGDDLWAALRAPELPTLTPSDVLDYRRRAMVWALATEMRRLGVQP